MAKLSPVEQLARFEELERLREIFPNTVEGLLSYADYVLQRMIPGKPRLNRLQASILEYMYNGPKYRMIQAQRGQAKTTLAGIYGSFTLIHNPTFRVTVFSQTGKRAREIAGWIIKIFTRLEILEFMRPDERAGDKSSVSEGFDLHWLFRGNDKTPSVSCYSIESGSQGARSDLVLADDIESLQNSRTAGGREWLIEQSKEFSSICQYGDIIYLGTPQSADSIYNDLPGRGYDIRIWPGRYPTLEEMIAYGGHLAPILVHDLERDPDLRCGGGLDGRRGKPTCPEMYSEDLLQSKEIELGRSKFDLQFMLSTRLSDAARYPLRLSDLVVSPFTQKVGPVMPVWSSIPSCIMQQAPRFGNKASDHFVSIFQRDYEWRGWDRKLMYIDPAGGGANGDESGYAVIFQLGMFLYLYDVGGVRGGYGRESLEALVKVAIEADCREVYIEENYGKGALEAAIKPVFEEMYPVTLVSDYSTGQKELRIIDALEPLMNTHRLIIRDSLLRKDVETTEKYSAEKRKTYQTFFQMAHITRDKGCLAHDDRLEAVASACARMMQKIAFDQKGSEAAQERDEYAEWLSRLRDRSQRVGVLAGRESAVTTGGSMFTRERTVSRRSW